LRQKSQFNRPVADFPTRNHQLTENSLSMLRLVELLRIYPTQTAMIPAESEPTNQSQTQVIQA
jgi:hypothetical protein